MVENDVWYDFNLLKFIANCFVLQYIVCPWNNPCAGEKKGYFAMFEWNVLLSPPGLIIH